MVRLKWLLAYALAGAALLGAGCESSSPHAAPVDRVSASAEEAAARADAMQEITPELRAMRQALESGAIDEEMGPCDYPEWLQDAIHFDARDCVR